MQTNNNNRTSDLTPTMKTIVSVILFLALAGYCFADDTGTTVCAFDNNTYASPVSVVSLIPF